MNRLLAPTLLASFCSGCLLFGSGPKAVPRYAIALPAPPSAAAAPAEDAPVLVLGRVKAAAAAARRDIAWVDAAGGRAGRLEDGALAISPEETVAAALRGYLPGIGAYRAVVPRELAPRGRNRVSLEAWVERFGLERDPQGGVAAVADLRFYLEPFTGGDPAALREIPLSARISVSNKQGALPSAAAAAKGLSGALESVLAKLRVELAR